MDSNTLFILQAIAGFIACWLAVAAIFFIKSLAFVEVHEEHEIIALRFGKVFKIFKEPGIYFFPFRVLPWVSTINVSLKRDMRIFENIQVNDSRGTSLTIDLTVELKIKDPVKALFAVESWEDSLKGFVIHTSSAILSAKTFEEIHYERLKIGDKICQEVCPEIEKWGIEIDVIFIKKILLLPEISHHMFNTIAAKLEKAKAHIEEKGRLNVHLLEAQTNHRIASLVAEAKGQYPAAVGRAYAHVGKDPEVLGAYKELYQLSQLRPHRTNAFFGFKENEINPVDAFMINQDFKEMVRN